MAQDKKVETTTEGDKLVKVEPEVKAAAEKINAEPVAKSDPVTPKKPVAKSALAKKKTKTKVKANAAKATSKPASKEEEIMTKMDVNNWFAAFELPTADKVEELVADANKKGEEFIAKSKSATEELAELTKANIEAMVEAGKIATSGAKNLGEELVADGRDGFEKASDTLKAFAAAKTPAEVLELQAQYMRSSFDHFVSEGSSLTEKWVKLAGDAMQPVSTRASLNAEKMKAMMA